MILFSAKKTAVHDMHLDAIAAYATADGLTVSQRVSGLSALRAVLGGSDKVVFSQSTGLASLLVLPLARLRGKRVVHYMHEPTPLKRKLKENPPVKSIIWHAVQWVEMHSATTVMVSREVLAAQAVAVYGVARSKVVLAPLLMPEVPPVETSGPKTRITYLGRIDERRFFQDFLEMAPAFRARGYVPTILTGDLGTLATYRDRVPPEIDLQAEANFSEELKARILGETHVLWNPKRGEIAQSGVTADAVRYGLPILLTDKDPAYESLLDKGIALDFHAAREKGFTVFDDITPEAVAPTAADVFSETHGATAFAGTYRPVLHAKDAGT